jgi:hypothetical protein
VLGKIPLATTIRETSDSGTPIVLADPDAPAAKAFVEAAAQARRGRRHEATSSAEQEARRDQLLNRMPKPAKINRHGAHDIAIVWDNGSVALPGAIPAFKVPLRPCEGRDDRQAHRHRQMLPILTYPHQNRARRPLRYRANVRR